MSFTPAEPWEDRPAALDPRPGESVWAWHRRIAAYEAASPGSTTPVDAEHLNDAFAEMGAYVDSVESFDAATLSEGELTVFDAASEKGVGAGITTPEVARRGQVARLNPKQFYGIVRDDFTQLGLRDATGLTVDGSGNLIASAPTTQGSGDIRLPMTLDRTLPFAASFLIEIGATSDGGVINCYLCGSSDTEYGVTFTASGTALNGNVGGLGSNPNTNSSPAAGFYELYVHSDGTRWACGIKKLTGAALVGNVTPAGDLRRTGANTDLRYDSTNPIWANVNTIRLKNGSATHKIHGVWVSLGSTKRPPGVNFGAATFTPILTPTDYATHVRVPATYTGREPIDLILVGHPNGSSETLGANAIDAGGGVDHAALLDAGYLMGYVRGDSASFTSAAASSWGAPAGQVPRIAFLDYLLTHFPQIRNVYWLGQSMGLLDGLNLHATYPGLIKAIVGVSGVTNLGYAHGTEGFSAAINTAYGTTTAAHVKDRDPALNPGLFTDLPMQLWHGTADPTVSKTNHPDLFATRVNALGGDVTVESVTDGAHLDAAMWTGVDSAEILAFLAANA